MSDSRPRSYSIIITNFCNASSIRGLRRAVFAEHRLMRMFWTFFVFFSIASVVYIGSFCIKAYTQYQTVVIRRKRPFVGSDFPSITLCSDAFMGNTEDARILARHPLLYQKYVEKLFENASDNKRFALLSNLRLLQTTVMYNINNLNAWANLSHSFLSIHTGQDSDKLTRNHSSIFCSIASHEAYGDCRIDPFYDLRYRNCLSFTTPTQQNHIRTEEMRIVVSFLADDDPPIFYSDPYIGNNVLLGLYVHVFLHETGTLPRPSPTFALTLNTHQWGVIDFDSNHLIRLETPRSQCNNSSYAPLLHGGSPIRMTEHTCRGYAQRKLVRSACKCEPWWPPLDNWPMMPETACGSLTRGLETALKDMKCMFSIEKGQKMSTDHDPPPDDCIEPCSQRHYDPHIHSNVLDMAIYEKMILEHQLMENLRNMENDCGDANMWSYGTRHAHCDKLFETVKDFFRNETARGNITQIHAVQDSDHKERQRRNIPLWRSVFPAISESDLHSRKKTTLKGRFLYLVVRPMAKNIEVDEESLVWSAGSTVAQLGGASSFLAGVSFVVFGELIELLYALCKQHRRGSKHSEQANVPVQNGIEEDVNLKTSSDV